MASNDERRPTRYERYTVRRVHRSELKNAPYNPRVISDAARRKLRENIRRVGLVQPIVWNERTGHIVSGHRRVEILDRLERTSDYHLTVAVVDLDEQTERAQNVMLNNPEAMGEFDLERLEELFRDPSFDIELAGFDAADKYKLMCIDDLAAEDLARSAEEIRARAKLYDEIAQKNHGRDNDDYYAVLVFRGHPERAAFCAALGLEDNRYVDGRVVMERIGRARAEEL